MASEVEKNFHLLTCLAVSMEILLPLDILLMSHNIYMDFQLRCKCTTQVCHRTTVSARIHMCVCVSVWVYAGASSMLCMGAGTHVFRILSSLFANLLKFLSLAPAPLALQMIWFLWIYICRYIPVCTCSCVQFYSIFCCCEYWKHA